MTLDEITLTNFKNIATARLELSPKLNCFLGNNGMGKSNMVDAIHYLSFCRSFSGAPDKLLIRRGETFAMLKARYTRHGAREDVSIGFAQGHRKSVKRGGKDYPRITEHIGNFPCVLISPSDLDLVNGTGEDRRRFINMAISQSDPRYLAHLMRYNEALQQRNRLLRDGCTHDRNLFEALETTMDASAWYLTQARRAFTLRLADIHHNYYNAIAGDSAEDIEIVYQDAAATNPDINAGDTTQPGWLSRMLDATRPRDIVMRYTTTGPHRDDLSFSLHGLPVRRTASQGQQKTFTIALRLAQYDFLSAVAGVKPLLLLDDIFDKLDADRVESIIKVVAGDTFGQIFITDTNRRHLDDIVRHMPSEYSLWQVENGNFATLG